MENAETTVTIPFQALKRSISSFQTCIKREPSKRVFVNRSLMLEKVKFFGFDMDYTLAVYTSPEYEKLGFNLLKNKMVSMGYPDAILDFEYDHTFPIRGLWFDKQYGTLLKVDGFGNILVCVCGFHFMRGVEIQALYPTKFVQMDEARFRIFNTLYELPLIYLLAVVINYFITNENCVRTNRGVKMGDVTMTFQSIYNDIGTAMQYVHEKDGPLKSETVKDVEKYVCKDDRLPTILTRLRENGKKVFLATNSDYLYTKKIMTHLFDTETNPDKRDWMSFFDFIVVDAKKPLFFSQGTILREVNKETGGLHLGTFTGNIKSGAIYSGGSVDVFNDLMGTTESEVIYVGDHIFGDILKSKKVRGWRTFLVVPELVQELSVWTQEVSLFEQLSEFDRQIADIYILMDSSVKTKPDITNIQKEIRHATHQMDQAYGKLGSVFRSGNRQTFFAAQVMRYADLYAASFMNLLNYPLMYVFRAPPMLMPHESTVDHGAKISDENFRKISLAWRSKVSELNNDQKTYSVGSSKTESESSDGHHRCCSVPKQLTEISDEFLEDEGGAPGQIQREDSFDED